MFAKLGNDYILSDFVEFHIFSENAGARCKLERGKI